MKALIKGTSEIGLELVDMPNPELGNNDVLIKVSAASICGSDVPIYYWDDVWTRNVVKSNQIIGHEFCGTVVEVGGNVTNVKAGDFVSAEGHLFCNECFHCKTGEKHICPNLRLVGFDYPGAFAEYIVIPSRNIVQIPLEIPPEVGSILDPLGNVVHACSKLPMVNSTVFISGCGPLGLMATLVSKLSGARTVIASDISNYRLDLAKKLGANITINPNENGFSDAISSFSADQGKIDVHLEMSGSANGLINGLTVLRPGGYSALVGLFKDEVTLNISDLIIAKGLTIQGIIGREIFTTWTETFRFLERISASNYIPLISLITHKIPIENFKEGFELMRAKTSGKIVFVF